MLSHLRWEDRPMLIKGALHLVAQLDMTYFIIPLFSSFLLKKNLFIYLFIYG